MMSSWVALLTTVEECAQQHHQLTAVSVPHQHLRGDFLAQQHTAGDGVSRQRFDALEHRLGPGQII